jgi:hypothetical protein
MKKLSAGALKKLIRQDNSDERFNQKLNDFSALFPAQCSGSIRYKLAYELVNLRQWILCNVEITFDQDERYSDIVDAEVISMDRYINLCTYGNNEFRAVYEKMMECIYGG